MTRPSPEELLSEAAQIAYYLHWPLDTILDLEHGDRRRFLREAQHLAAYYAPSAAGYENEPVEYGTTYPEGFYE